MTQINISQMNKAAVLAALYNSSKPQGLGILHFTPEKMTQSEAETILNQTQHFDYLKGRVMKIRLDEDMLQTDLYDRDNGDGAAERALQRAGLLPRKT